MLACRKRGRVSPMCGHLAMHSSIVAKDCVSEHDFEGHFMCYPSVSKSPRTGVTASPVT